MSTTFIMVVNDRFGDELSLEEILTDQEKAEDKFLRSARFENFGPEMTLDEVLEILFVTSLPPRAGFWEKHEREVDEALHNFADHIEIEHYHFRIEYTARIVSVRKFDFGAPMMYRKFMPNGKVTNDPEGSDSDSSSTGSSSDSDV